jgi:hypothetical protein
MWRVWETREIRTGFWCGALRKEDHFEYIGVDCRIILKWIFKKWDGEKTGLIWLRIGTGRPALVNAVLNLRVP